MNSGANLDAINNLTDRVAANELAIIGIEGDIDDNTVAIFTLQSMVETNEEAIGDIEGDVEDV